MMLFLYELNNVNYNEENISLENIKTFFYRLLFDGNPLTYFHGQNHRLINL